MPQVNAASAYPAKVCALLNNVSVAAVLAALEEPVLDHAVRQQIEQKKQDGNQHHSPNPKKNITNIELETLALRPVCFAGLGINQHRDPPFHPPSTSPAGTSERHQLTLPLSIPFHWMPIPPPAVDQPKFPIPRQIPGVD